MSSCPPAAHTSWCPHSPDLLSEWQAGQAAVHLASPMRFSGAQLNSRPSSSHVSISVKGSTVHPVT